PLDELGPQPGAVELVHRHDAVAEDSRDVLAVADRGGGAVAGAHAAHAAAEAALAPAPAFAALPTAFTAELAPAHAAAAGGALDVPDGLLPLALAVGPPDADQLGGVADDEDVVADDDRRAVTGGGHADLPQDVRVFAPLGGRVGVGEAPRAVAAP